MFSNPGGCAQIATSKYTGRVARFLNISATFDDWIISCWGHNLVTASCWRCVAEPRQKEIRRVFSHTAPKPPQSTRLHPPDGSWHLPPWFHHPQKEPGYIPPAHGDLSEEKTVYSVDLNNNIPHCFIVHHRLLFLQHKNVPFLSEGLWWLQASSSQKSWIQSEEVQLQMFQLSYIKKLQMDLGNC